jgi:hypothetical protein
MKGHVAFHRATPEKRHRAAQRHAPRRRRHSCSRQAVSTGAKGCCCAIVSMPSGNGAGASNVSSCRGILTKASLLAGELGGGAPSAGRYRSGRRSLGPLHCRKNRYSRTALLHRRRGGVSAAALLLSAAITSGKRRNTVFRFFSGRTTMNANIKLRKTSCRRRRVLR